MKQILVYNSVFVWLCNVVWLQRSVFFLKSIDVDSFDTVELINILSGTHIVLEGSQSVFFGFVGFLDYKLLKIGEKKKPNWIFVFEF